MSDTHTAIETYYASAILTAPQLALICDAVNDALDVLQQSGTEHAQFAGHRLDEAMDVLVNAQDGSPAPDAK